MQTICADASLIKIENENPSQAMLGMKTEQRPKHSPLGLYLRRIKPLRDAVIFVRVFIYRTLIRRLPRYSYKFGVFQALRLIFMGRFGHNEFQFAIPGIPHPIWIRPRTSDIDVLDQVFVGEAYDLPFAIPAQLILDVGANVGYASIYFAKRYPNARIVAVEPEPSNFRALVKNTKPYPNVIAMEAAIWPKAAKLNVDNSGPAWTSQVTTEGTAGMPSVNGITVDDVLAQCAGRAPVDLLKIDIEGAEKELFSAPCDSWLARTRIIVIELHDRMVPGCEQALERATRHYRFLKMVKGEDTILLRNE